MAGSPTFLAALDKLRKIFDEQGGLMGFCKWQPIQLVTE